MFFCLVSSVPHHITLNFYTLLNDFINQTKLPQLNLIHSFLFVSMFFLCVNLLHRVQCLFDCFCIDLQLFFSTRFKML